ncbi:MAG TPA: bifunctional nuclease family protein, partial [Armatimonadetes bacterium]|nr:bifunctional nuclease family protein [Armatimonadota bacterium]
MEMPIWIGEPEAVAIELELRQMKAMRPLTHDLMCNMLEEIGVEVVRVIINDLRDDTFYAVITLQWGNDTFEIDARPSDSIALALRANAPIYVAEHVARTAGIHPKPSDEETERFMRLVGDIDLPEL